ncbi:MAG: 2-oxoacid:acceptor oxidoreductase family protein [Sulfolobales archaeon]
MRSLRLEILIAGRGGQGILLIGRILGKAIAKYTNYYILASESYSAEVRGGDSRVDLIIADTYDEADFIKVRSADIALFMHQSQLEAYLRLVKENATIFIDQTNIIDHSVMREISSSKVYLRPYTEIAERVFGTGRIANIIALGHMIKTTRIVDPEAVERVIIEEVPREWLELDRRAFRYSVEKLDS